MSAWEVEKEWKRRLAAVIENHGKRVRLLTAWTQRLGRERAALERERARLQRENERLAAENARLRSLAGGPLAGFLGRAFEDPAPRDRIGVFRRDPETIGP